MVQGPLCPSHCAAPAWLQAGRHWPWSSQVSLNVADSEGHGSDVLGLRGQATPHKSPVRAGHIAHPQGRTGELAQTRLVGGSPCRGERAGS